MLSIWGSRLNDAIVQCFLAFNSWPVSLMLFICFRVVINFTVVETVSGRFPERLNNFLSTSAL